MVGELESRALEMLREERRVTRLEALRALEGAWSREAVEQVLAALYSFESDDRLYSAAARTLKTCQHPAAVKLMVAWVQKTAEKDAFEYSRFMGIPIVLDVLAERRSPAIARLATELLGEFGARAARALVNSADRKQLQQLARRLRGKDGNLFASAVECVFRTSKNPFRDLAPLFTARDRHTTLGDWRIREVLENLLKHRARISDEWHRFLLSALENDPALPLAPWFAARRDRLAIPALLKAAVADDGDLRYHAIEALGGLRAPEALDAVFDCLWMKHLRWTMIVNAARRIPGAAEKLRARLDGVKRPKSATHQPARDLLDLLEA